MEMTKRRKRDEFVVDEWTHMKRFEEQAIVMVVSHGDGLVHADEPKLRYALR